MVMPGHRDRQPRAQQRLASEIAARRTLLQGAAQHHIFDFRRIDAGTPHCLRNRVARQFLPLSVVERAAIRFADRRARGGNNDCFAHGKFLG